MKILIINGANLNLVGRRETGIYGDTSMDDYIELVIQKYKIEGVAIDYFQSNVEGEIVDRLQSADVLYDGIILNAGGYTHTSVVIADAVAAIATPVVEVHISNILARQEFRHISLISPNCVGSIIGFGLVGYDMAIDYLCGQ